jgi:hypothetical protein
MSRRLPDLLFPLLLTSLNLSHAAPITLEFEEIPVKPLFTRGLIPSDVTVPSVTTYVSASPDQWGNQGIYPATLSAYDPTGSLLGSLSVSDSDGQLLVFSAQALHSFELASTAQDNAPIAFNDLASGSTTTIPIPAALWLFASGIISIGLLGRSTRDNS